MNLKVHITNFWETHSPGASEWHFQVVFVPVAGCIMFHEQFEDMIRRKESITLMAVIIFHTPSVHKHNTNKLRTHCPNIWDSFWYLIISIAWGILLKHFKTFTKASHAGSHRFWTRRPQSSLGSGPSSVQWYLKPATRLEIQANSAVWPWMILYHQCTKI